VVVICSCCTAAAQGPQNQLALLQLWYCCTYMAAVWFPDMHTVLRMFAGSPRGVRTLAVFINDGVSLAATEDGRLTSNTDM
jgi:hypothetical protein